MFVGPGFDDGDVCVTDTGLEVLIYLNDGENFSDGNAQYFWDLDGKALNKAAKLKYGNLSKKV